MNDRYTQRIFLRVAEGSRLSFIERRHLAGCAACQGAAERARRFDAELGREMAGLASVSLPDLAPRTTATTRPQVAAGAFVALAAAAAIAAIVVLRPAAPDMGTAARPSPGATPSSVAPAASPTPSARPIPTPSAAPTDRPATLEWTSAPMPDAAPGVYGGGFAQDVVATDDGFVAVGGVNGGCCTGGFSEDTRALVWTSVDGTSWTLVPESPELAAGRMMAVTRGDAGFVAVGAVARNVEGNQALDAAAWFSADGVTWTFASVPTVEDAILVDVTAGGPGFVAVGTTTLGDLPTAWVSEDGRTWTALDETQFPAAGAQIRAVATGPSGLVVAVGAVQSLDANAAPADVGVAWASSDGVNWSRTDTQDSLTNGSMHAVTAYRDGWVAVGSDAAIARAAAWMSSDGLRWERVVTPSGDYMTDVVASGDRLVATGPSLATGTVLPSVWTSTDGREWTETPNPTRTDLFSGEITGLTTIGDELVAVGYLWDDHPVPTAFHARRTD